MAAGAPTERVKRRAVEAEPGYRHGRIGDVTCLWQAQYSPVPLAAARSGSCSAAAGVSGASCSKSCWADLYSDDNSEVVPKVPK